jgi:hypothetical protein
MAMTRLLLSAALVLASSSLAGPALAADTSTSLHSGVIVSIDTTTHRLQLQEMGPWTSGATKPVTRSIGFGRDTKFELVTRAKGANPQGWIGGYVESPLTASAVHPGDFATVTVEHDRKGPEAAMVQVVRPVGPTS